MYRLLLLVAACLGAHHPEILGEDPEPEDVDNGQCIPIKCELGVPPRECTRLCALRHYLPVCRPPGDYCLCQHLVGNSMEFVSPDEVMDQPADPGANLFSMFAVIKIPLKSFFLEDVESPEGTVEPVAEEFATVNVHEGRLFWDFRYILTGLFLLMIGLIIYELIMCRVQARREKVYQTEPPLQYIKS